jgi:hypothetical protein
MIFFLLKSHVPSTILYKKVRSIRNAGLRASDFSRIFFGGYSHHFGICDSENSKEEKV